MNIIDIMDLLWKLWTPSSSRNISGVNNYYLCEITTNRWIEHITCEFFYSVVNQKEIEMLYTKVLVEANTTMSGLNQMKNQLLY